MISNYAAFHCSYNETVMYNETLTNRDEQSTTAARHRSVKYNEAVDKMGTL